MLMELTDVSVRALLIFFKRSCKVARFLRTGKKKSMSKESLGKYR